VPSEEGAAVGKGQPSIEKKMKTDTVLTSIERGGAPLDCSGIREHGIKAKAESEKAARQLVLGDGSVGSRRSSLNAET